MTSLIPTTGQSPKDFALMYAERFGWKVFPVWPIVPGFQEGDPGICACARGAECDRPGKHPLSDLVPSGVSDATDQRAKIENWWGQQPTASIGIATGRQSGLTVVDADTGNGKPGLLNLTRMCADRGGVPQTMTVETGGGGLHLYFAFDAGLRTGTNVLDEAIDVRSDGGFVVAPPSGHASGGTYTWRNNRTDLLPLPEYMVNAPRDAAARIANRLPQTPSLRGHFSLEKVQGMLECIESHERGQWLKVGLLLGKLFVGTEAEGEAWDEYEAWAAKSEKFDETRAQNIERMREQFFEISQQPPRAGQSPIGIGTLIHWAKKGGWTPTPDVQDTDHYRLADALVNTIANETGSRPVFVLGAMWRVEDALWLPWSMDDVAGQVGRRYGGGKVCRRGGDFSSIARLATGIAGDEGFFAQAPIGIAAPSGFWHVEINGEIRCDTLNADHRQRMRVTADPVIGGQPEKLLRMLEEAFAGHDPAEQIQLLQQLTGCALTRSLWRHRKVASLNGATSSGKSTYLNVLRAAFPQDQIAATSPTRWGSEYYLAALAGKALNIVGELDDREPIPGGAFKAITGRDLVQGRHPTHRPFSFVCEAAHFFNSNRNPPTTDRDDAFFRRWRILYFANAVPVDREQRNLDEEIIATEFGEFLGWALEGAAMVARSGTIIETEPHRRALARWRVGNNSALEFLLDPDECVVERDASTAGQRLFKAYRTWAENAGVRPFGRSGFYEAVEKGGALAEVRLARRDHQVFVDGVRYKGSF